MTESRFLSDYDPTLTVPPWVDEARIAGVAGIARPLLRVGAFEVSIPIEYGYSKAVDSSYRMVGVDLGVAFF